MDIIDQDGNPIRDIQPRSAGPAAPLPWGVKREVSREVARTFGDYQVERVRLAGAAAIAEMGLDRLDDLEARETRAARDPINGGSRHRRIVDEFEAVVRQSVRRVGGRW